MQISRFCAKSEKCGVVRSSVTTFLLWLPRAKGGAQLVGLTQLTITRYWPTLGNFPTELL